MTLSLRPLASKLPTWAIVVILAALPLSAQIKSTDFSPGNLTLNGNAAWIGEVNPFLRLTPNQINQIGSAWFNTPQQVTIAGGFSTTFTFQLSGANQFLCGESPCPADGIAFVIQNSGSTAIGPDGCGIGFGGNTLCTSGSGISNSLAVEFDTFNNGAPDLNSANHVAIQSCPNMGANTTDLTANPSCTIANNANLNVTLADGNPHTVTITYSGPTSNLLDVILDNQDLFPGGVAFDLSTLGLGNNNTAFVGFTASTGGADDNQDILSWSLTLPAQSAVITTGQQAVLNFANNAFNYNAQLTQGNPVTGTIQPILIDEESCEQLVDASFPGTQCFVYQNAGGTGVDSAVLFELTCPQSAGGTCGTPNAANFFAELGSNFTFTKAENEFFIYPGIAGFLNPFPGWLKGSGPDPQHPCTANPGNSPALFQSNQIDAFSVTGDPGGKTLGKSGGTGSCWVATYLTSGEVPPGITITSPRFTTYTQGQVVVASYTCSNPASSQPLANPTGPYLTAATCTQSQTPKPNASFNTNTCNPVANGIACTGPVDTSILGVHLFFVTSTDTGGNQSIQPVIYAVKRRR